MAASKRRRRPPLTRTLVRTEINVDRTGLQIGTTQQSEYGQEREMSMRTIRTRTLTCAVAMAAVLSLAPLRAQTTQTALSKEAGTLSDKFAGLARVMAGEYSWKPGGGVRSGSDVFNLRVTGDGVVVGTLTGARGGGGGGGQ